jgi:hypothetical protein
MEETVKTVQEQKPWLFKKGQSGNPAGRPKESISIKDKIRQMLRDNPDEFEELCKYYMKDKRMRDLLWRMLEGQPPQSTDITSGGQPIEFKVTLTEENGDRTAPETK